MTERIRDVNGREWQLGCLPRTTTIGDGTFKVFEPGPAKPRGKSWVTIEILKGLVWHIINQAQQNSCCGCAGIGIAMLDREIRGLEKVILSQASIYALGNGGRDQGMAIDTCLDILRKVGACPISVIDQYDWQGYERGTWPENWREVAKNYRALEWEDCPDLAAMKAANEEGFPVIYGAKGHAVYRLGIDANSWDYSWGDQGLGIWATDAELRREIPRYGAWVLRVATDPRNDGDLPQPS